MFHYLIMGGNYFLSGPLLKVVCVISKMMLAYIYI